MATTANAVQILTTLEYLGDYSAKKYFGVIVQVGLGTTNAADVAVDVNMANLLQPWRWVSASKTAPNDPKHTTSPLVVTPPDISIWKILAGKTTPKQIATKMFPMTGSIDASITNQLSDDCDLTIASGHLAWTDPVNGQTGRGDRMKTFPWPAHLAQVARYPYPIPHLLNLCFFLSVTDEGTLPAAGDTVFAAVGFKAVVKNNPVTYSPQIDKLTISADKQRLVIPASNDSTVFITTENQVIPQNGLTPVPTIIPPASTFSAETTDWQIHLPTGAADVFDFSDRLVNSVRQACDTPLGSKMAGKADTLKQAVADSFNAFSATVLIAQREIVAYGGEKAPSGTSLLQRMLDQWVNANPQNSRDFADRFVKAASDQRAADQSDTAGANSRWMTLLQKNHAFVSNSLVQNPASNIGLGGSPPKPYDPNNTYRKDDVALFATKRFKALHDGKLVSPDSQKATSDWVQVISPAGINVANLSDRLLAVEHLQLQFTQPEILTQILAAQWQEVFDANPGSQLKDTDKSFLQSFLSSSTSALVNYDVRGLLLQCNVGQQSWKAITADLSSRDAVRANFSIEFNRRLKSLFNLLPNAPASTILSGPFQDWLTPWIAERLKTLVPYRLNSGSDVTPPAGTDNAQPTRASSGLSVLVDGLDDGSYKDASDSLRSISGMCILMRQKDGAEWRCLDAGIPIANLAAKENTPAITNRNNTVVIPVPLHNQDGLRRATFTYNNQPVMSASPAHGLGAGVVPSQKAFGNSDRLISFQHPSVMQALDNSDDLKQWKIPGLGFSRSFDFLLGRCSNSGALPPEFADPASGPAVLKLKAIASALKPTISSVPYRRTVPLADLRFASSFKGDSRAGSPSKSGSLDKLRMPAIPSDVHPRAQELFPTADPAPGSAPDKPTTPLVMLTPYTVPTPAPSQFTLSVRKPTTDFLTWDRMQAGLDDSSPGTDSSIRKARINAWQLFHTFARSEDSTYDLALEDPVIGSLSLSVSALWPKNLQLTNVAIKQDDQTISWLDAEVADPAASPKRVQTATPSIDININASIDANSAPTAAKTGTYAWTITLPPGSIAKIQLTPSPKKDMGKFFAPGILQTPKAYSVIVETANADLPQRKDLHDAFDLVPPLAPDSNSVDFALTGSANSAAWLQVSHVDVKTQVWRWDGRPFSQFPFSDVASIPYGNANAAIPKQPSTDNLLNWELETFATRSESDATSRPMTRIKAADPIFQAHDDRGSELGATYYRAGVTAYNRYGSLVPLTVMTTSPDGSQVEVPARSCSSLDVFASVPGIDGNWARRYVPARVSADASVPAGFKPPKPAIKYIVPLTGGTALSEAAASSVLVVVQGPWFAIGGLAEDLSATITNSTAPRDKTPDPKQLPEAGPDPILYAGAQSDLPRTFDPYGSPFPSTRGPDSRFHGPVGHTFDLADANPLWVTSSFVLDPPSSKGSAAQESTFARVQFSRILRKQGVVVQNLSPTDPTCSVPKTPPPKATLMPACGDFGSEATNPVWVQFLPSRFFPYSETFDNLVLNYKSGSISVNVRKDGAVVDPPITLNLNPSRAGAINLSHIVFGLLLTQLVPDLIGRPNQERFVDLVFLKPSASGITSASWSFTLKPRVPEPDLIGRMVVIQRQVSTSAGCDPQNQSTAQPPCDLTSTSELWNEIFPVPPPNTQISDADAFARIISVSPPIFASDSASPNLSCQTDATYAAGD